MILDRQQLKHRLNKWSGVREKKRQLRPLNQRHFTTVVLTKEFKETEDKSAVKHTRETQQIRLKTIAFGTMAGHRQVLENIDQEMGVVGTRSRYLKLKKNKLKMRGWSMRKLYSTFSVFWQGEEREHQGEGMPSNSVVCHWRKVRQRDHRQQQLLKLQKGVGNYSVNGRRGTKQWR